MGGDKILSLGFPAPAAALLSGGLQADTQCRGGLPHPTPPQLTQVSTASPGSQDTEVGTSLCAERCGQQSTVKQVPWIPQHAP